MKALSYKEKQEFYEKVCLMKPDLISCAESAFAYAERLCAERSLSAQDEVLTDAKIGEIADNFKFKEHYRSNAEAIRFARAVLAAAAPSPAVAVEPWAPTEEQFEQWRARHGLHHSHNEAFYDAASLYLEATPPALAGSQVQAAGDTRVKEWERACREIIDRCVAPDMYRNAREMLDRAVTEALRTLP